MSAPAGSAVAVPVEPRVVFPVDLLCQGAVGGHAVPLPDLLQRCLAAPGHTMVVRAGELGAGRVRQGGSFCRRCGCETDRGGHSQGCGRANEELLHGGCLLLGRFVAGASDRGVETTRGQDDDVGADVRSATLRARQKALPLAGAVRDPAPGSDGDLEEQLETVLVVPRLADLDEPQPRDGGERGRVVRADAGADDTYVGFPRGPPEQLPGDRARVPLPAVPRAVGVADLDPALLVGRPVEAAATDDYAEVRVEDQAGDPLTHGRVLGDLRNPTPPGRLRPLLDEVAAQLETGGIARRGELTLGEGD